MRKFTCPFCGYEHVFSPKGKSKHRKRVSGFTCPRCQKKATDDEIRKSKGKGPKPPGERRKRKKKADSRPPDIVPIIIPVSQQFETNNIEWRQKDQQHRPPSEAIHPSARPRRRQPQPMERTLGEAAFMMTNIVPAGTVNIEDEPELVEKVDRKVELEEIEMATEALDEARKKLRGVAINLSSIERKLNGKIDEIDASTEKLDRNIQTLSTLLSHLEKVMEEDRRKRTRIR